MAARGSEDRPGYELPLHLAGAFRTLVDALHLELAERGHPEARPIHGFALQAIGRDGTTVTELGRRLGVSRQGAAKTVAGLERAGYVSRERDAGDRRAVLLRPTAAGVEMLALSAEIFERLRREWAERIGVRRLARLEDDLAELAAPGGAKLGDLPGWLR